MSFKVGDRVRIVSNLEIDEEYYNQVGTVTGFWAISDQHIVVRLDNGLKFSGYYPERVERVKSLPLVNRFKDILLS